VRFASAALVLPDTVQEYTRGKPKHARTPATARILHTFGDLIDRGVRVIAGKTRPLRIDSGLEYFRRRLGFQPHTLLLRRRA
jgi:hypothetical protein